MFKTIVFVLFVANATNAFALTCRNGVYLSPHWLKGVKTASEKTALCKKLKDAHVAHVFIYANGIHAKTPDLGFLNELKKAVPALQITAMMGRRVCGHTTTHCFKLFEKTSRDRLIESAQDYWKLGFDGVQLDLEPVETGNQELISILDQLRAKKPQGTFVSLAGYSLALEGDIKHQIKATPKNNQTVLIWEKYYYKQILSRVDQVMVMNYDTALWTSSSYKSFTEWQTHALKAIMPPSVSLQMGLPSNVPGRTGLFDRKVENLMTGSDGIAAVLGTDCPSNFGVTIFTEDGMTDALWAHFIQTFAATPTSPPAARTTQ